jgi:adenylate kinase
MKAILIGAPGAGKGTQAAILKNEYGLQHIASGDLLREAVRNNTPLGRTAKVYMDRGQLVPDDVVIGMIIEKLQQGGANGQAVDESGRSARNGVIFDGFPRTLEQARALEQALTDMSEPRIDAVLYLDVPQEVLLERLTQRYQCAECGAIYNWSINPTRQEGLCDRCGGGLYQRMDDNERVIGHRLDAYFRQTLPLIRHYETMGQLHRIDGNQPIKQVTTQILQALAQARQVSNEHSPLPRWGQERSDDGEGEGRNEQ